MSNNDKNGDNSPKKEMPNQSSAFFETDYGTRKINQQNWSKMVAIPPHALKNCGCENVRSVNVKLVQENGHAYIKLTPLNCKPKQKRDSK